MLHWLPVEWRIKFKIACITYKTISTTQPAYLYSSLKHYTPSRTLRSPDSKLLFVPRVRTCFGSRSFAVAVPTIWNSLPLDIRSSVSIYSCTQNVLTPHPTQRHRFGGSLADTVRSINLIYLSTTYLLTWGPSCASLVAIRSFAREREGNYSKITIQGHSRSSV